MPGRCLPPLVAAAVCVVALQACTAASAPHRPPPSATSTPTAGPDRDLPAYATVGALFRQGAGARHSCTASVIASSAGDTLITAAHCVSGAARGMTFVPDYRAGHSRFGVWHVTGAYVPGSWQRTQNPRADFAVLTVAPHDRAGRLVQIASITGSEELGAAPSVGSTITVVAYNSGSGDLPVVCRAKVFRSAGFPTFACHGFIGGSSGSPWLSIDATGQAVVEGVIGGYHQGGCHEYRSHTSAFTSDVRALVRRAEQGRNPDTVVPAHGDGC